MELPISFIEYHTKNRLASERGKILVPQLRAHGRCDAVYRAEVQGTANQPYHVAADLTDLAAPRFQCSCPSRQHPCKHVAALLWAIHLTPEAFKIIGVPPLPTPSLRSPKKQPSPIDMPTAAARKEGLLIARQLLLDLVRDGFGSLSPSARVEWKTRARGLTAFSLPGIARRLIGLLSAANPKPAAVMLDQFSYLLQKIDESRAYLDALDADAEVIPALESFMGKIWRLVELEPLGFCKHDARLLQLFFTLRDQPEARQTVDEAVWADLSDGNCYARRHMRPYAARLAPEDTIDAEVRPASLYFYPDSARINWNRCTLHDPAPDALAALCRQAQPTIASALTTAHERLMSGQVTPMLIHFSSILASNDTLFLRDTQGALLPLSFLEKRNFSLTEPLSALLRPEDDTMLVRLYFSSVRNTPMAEPLCLLSPKRRQQITL